MYGAPKGYTGKTMFRFFMLELGIFGVWRRRPPPPLYRHCVNGRWKRVMVMATRG